MEKKKLHEKNRGGIKCVQCERRTVKVTVKNWKRKVQKTKGHPHSRRIPTKGGKKRRGFLQTGLGSWVNQKVRGGANKRDRAKGVKNVTLRLWQKTSGINVLGRGAKRKREEGDFFGCFSCRVNLGEGGFYGLETGDQPLLQRARQVHPT